MVHSRVHEWAGGLPDDAVALAVRRISGGGLQPRTRRRPATSHLPFNQRCC